MQESEQITGRRVEVPLLTVDEVAFRLAVSPHWVYRKIAAGEIVGVKLGDAHSSPVRVSVGEFNRFVQEHTTGRPNG